MDAGVKPDLKMEKLSAFGILHTGTGWSAINVAEKFLLYWIGQIGSGNGGFIDSHMVLKKIMAVSAG